MSIYHCSIQIIGRSSGRSAVAAAAYRTAEKLEDKETGLTHDYTKKQGVVHREIMLPEYAPEEYKNREILWNEVQKIEKRSNAQLAREIEVALPRELSRADQMIAVRVYVQMNFVEKGMCADWVLHDKGDGNPHAHIMLTTRPIRKNGQWGTKEKNRTHWMKMVSVFQSLTQRRVSRKLTVETENSGNGKRYKQMIGIARKRRKNGEKPGRTV